MEPVGHLKRLIDASRDHAEQIRKDLAMDWHEPKFDLGVGEQVWKPKGYAFEGTVVSAFVTLGGEVRYVVESRLAPGLLHIFNGDQVKKVEL